jgi:fructose-bisphosphate aldolase class II
LGVVGYAGGAASTATDAIEAARMAATGIDALAVSVGNVHLMQEADATIDRSAIARITAACPGLPLVLHGGSGISAADRRALALDTAICKFNIGTELRMAFGAALRNAVVSDPAQFDRIALLSKTMAPMRVMAGQILRQLAR